MKNKTPPIEKTLVDQSKKDSRPVFNDGDRWICAGCGRDVFGIFENGVLHVKYKDRRMSVEGVVTVICRTCKLENRIDTREHGINVDLVINQDVDLGQNPD